MSILSTIKAAASVGPYPVRQIGSAYFVGPWGVSADSNFLGPYPIQDADNGPVGPFPWVTIDGVQFLGPWVVA